MAQKIDWQLSNWASNCEFVGHDMQNERMPWELCGPYCEATQGCTHYTWSNDVCYLKSSAVRRKDAHVKADCMCGVVYEAGHVIRPAKRDLIFADEFDSVYEFARNWSQSEQNNNSSSTDLSRNSELQYYTDDNQNVKISDNKLSIISKKEDYKGKKFTSARLISTRAFKYGVFEIRARLPRGRGVRSSFWLQPARKSGVWPRDGRIDLMDYVGYDLKSIHASIDCESFNYIIGTQIGRSIKLPDVSNEFHRYQLEWRPNRILAFVDDQLFFRYDKPAKAEHNEWPFDDEFNIGLSNSVGGTCTDAYGIDETIFPSHLLIDYVRVYNLS